MNSWFSSLTGFDELDYAGTRDRLEVVGTTLRSRVNGRSCEIGALETPTLGELRARAAELKARVAGSLRVSTVVGDAGELHREPANHGALFQVASQFNLLEMTGPDVTPEDGVTRYAWDRTQGPACAIAAGAATIYRNYFVPVDSGIGQTATRQIDCLRDVGDVLGNRDGSLWDMRNGYALPSPAGLAATTTRLRAMTTSEVDAVRDVLRIGVHSQVEVTSAGSAGLRVSQAFCSALPVAYTSMSPGQWTPFATLVLEAAYESTLWAGVLNAARTGSPLVYLTRVGGGAFGNDVAWIDAAIRRALTLVDGCGLDVRLVSYGKRDGAWERLVGQWL